MTLNAKLLRHASVLAMLLNFVAIAGHFYLARMFSRGVIHPAGALAPITGVTVGGSMAANLSAGCHVVRYTSIHCPWCQRDQPTWDNFAQTLQQNGCDSTSLGPSGDDMPREVDSLPNRQFLVAVPAEFAQNVDLLATPTTIVLDRNWNVLWSRVGILGPDDAREAAATLR
jgi:hypothetical protein